MTCQHITIHRYKDCWACVDCNRLFVPEPIEEKCETKETLEEQLTHRCQTSKKPHSIDIIEELTSERDYYTKAEVDALVEEKVNALIHKHCC